ncbi:hypothetical protein, partial [Stutzerimonas kunmingensis]
LGTTDLNGGALFNAEFGIRHRGSTVPERSGVALSFCRRQVIKDLYFYINEFFGQAEIEIHEKLNPAILEYLNLPPQLQLTILKTLDEDAFRSDSNKAGNNQI